MNRILFFQLMRFGIVGSAAALVHFTLVVSMVELTGMKPLFANAIALLFSFQISYFGHRAWTFRGTTARHGVAFPKLLMLQGFNFFANEGLFYILMRFFHLPYPVALIIVLAILPLFTFTVSKLWIF